jgi:hypothetical protein
MCDPAKEAENLGKSLDQAGRDFDHTVGISAVSREATNAAKAIGSTVEAIAQDPKKLAAVGIMIAFPGAASAVGSYLMPASVAAAYPTMAAIVGQTAINAATNGGDVKQAVTSALISQGAPELTKYVANSFATEGVSKAITDWAAKAAVNTSIASALGKDPAAAFLFSGAQAATDAVMNMTGVSTTMSMLPKEAQSALKAAITAKMMNIDPTKAVAQDLVNQAIGTAKNMAKAQWYTKSNDLPPLTEEQLSKVVSPDPNQSDYQNERDINSSIKNIVNDAKAQREGWADDQEKFTAAQQGISDPNEYASKKFVAYGDIFGTGVQAARYVDGRVRTADDDAPRAPTANEAVALARSYKLEGQDVPQIILDALPKSEEPKAELPEAPETPEAPVGGLPTEPPTEPEAPVGGLPTEPEKPVTEEPEIDLDKWKPQEPVGGLPTEPTLDNELEPPEGINPTPVLDNELEPPSLLPTEPTLDNELEESCAPGYHWNGSMCVPDDDEPPESTDCPEGYVYDLGSKSCVPVATPPGTKPPATKPPATTPPGTKPPATTPTTPTGGLPTTAQSTSPTIPWLDTKPQMLEVKGGAKSRTSDQALQQLYNNVDPNLMDVFAERGFTPQSYSGGSSVTSVFSDFQSSLEKGTPKFAPVRDAMISTGTRKAKQSGLGSATQLPQIRPSMTGNAKGGLPAKYAQAAPKGHNPEFITGLTGFYANGRGTGQSDDIPAMLHDGDYVMDADTVAALGDGSSKAGALSLADFQKQVPHKLSSGGSAVPAKIADGEYVFPEPLVTSLGGGDNKKGAKLLDAMREEIRAHKRSAPTSKIPPKAKSPLDYLKMVKG